MPDSKVFHRVEPFQSASELRDEHIGLLEELNRQLMQDTSEKNELAALAQLEPQIRQFLERGAATGIYLEEIEERTVCQVLLDYWISSLSRAGIQVADTRFARFDSEQLPILKDEDCPYVGLEAFRDKTYFFGREGGTRKLLEQVLDSPLVVVIGASGSGKSSLVMGGVLPALHEKGAAPELLIVPPFFPGNTVLDNLVNAVRQVYPAATGVVAEEVALLRKDPIRLSVMVGGAHATPTLITIDQFEEVFTLSPLKDREALAANLAKFLEAGRGHRVILTVRAEFESELRTLEPLREYLEKKNSRYLMQPMSYEELKAAVENPAALVNLQFQSGILDDLVKNVLGQDAALPLLQFTLRSLWQKRKRNRITWEVYKDVGNPLNALQNSADEFYKKIPENRDEIERILLELVRVDDRLEAYRQPVPKSRLLQAGKANTEKVLKLLADNDFVRIRPGASGADSLVEVKHESLVRNWPQFVMWINQKRDKRGRRLALAQAAKQWKESGKPKDGLFTGWQLQEAKAQPDLSDLENEFIQACTEAIDKMQKEKEADLRREAEQVARLKMTRRLAWGFGILTALLISGFITYRYLFVWEYQSYYNTIVKVYGIPKGVDKKLTREQYKARSSSLKIVKKGARGDDIKGVLRMEAVNGSGVLTPYHDVGTYFDPCPYSKKISPSRECRWEYIFDSKGNIMYERAYNKFNKLVWILIYSPPPDKGQALDRDALYLTEKRTPGKETSEPELTSGEVSVIPFIFSEAKIVNIKYSSEGYDKGFEKQINYFDIFRHPNVGPEKAFGRILEYDEKRLLTKLTSVDRHNKPMNNDAGNATLKMTHGELGNIVEMKGFDKSSNPIMLKDGWHAYKAKYDSPGNCTESAYFGLRGEPILHEDRYHKATYKYDDRGNLTEGAFFGLKGEPIQHKDVYHRITGKYDDRGNLTESAYFGLRGEPILITNEYHKATGKYNNQGNRTEWAYFGLRGEPILHKDRYHKATGKYNNQGNLIEWAFFGLKEEPILTKNGYHKATGKYNNRGNATRVAYFGTDGKPKLHNDGYASWTNAYDDRGNVISEAFFGTNAKPILRKDGYHKVTWKYDSRGNKIEETFYDERKHRVDLYIFKDFLTCSRVVYAYDNLGKLREKKCYDKDDRFVDSKKY